jgi:hypothetical protein
VEIKFRKGVIHFHFLPELFPAKHFYKFKDLFSLMKFKSRRLVLFGIDIAYLSMARTTIAGVGQGPSHRVKA